ncbi:MAG: hypothetical protein A2064_13490 [Spirochaetes bacterium GWB1_66_5]|nr:MAG: hypothetical protein A2064_13490 [Spirochaetes bacterium GWB1_66_5]
MLTVALAYPAFSEVRLDLGVDVPLVAGFISGGDVTSSSEIGTFLTEHIFPFPEASIYYQFKVGPLRVAPGVRFFTFILESVMWPNVIAELELGPVFIEGQLGGLVFGYFGVVTGLEFGQVLIPDLSIWVGLGKKKMFRLGAGAIGLMLPEISTSQMLFAGYIGVKVSLTPWG